MGASKLLFSHVSQRVFFPVWDHVFITLSSCVVNNGFQFLLASYLSSAEIVNEKSTGDFFYHGHIAQRLCFCLWATIHSRLIVVFLMKLFLARFGLFSERE